MDSVIVVPVSQPLFIIATAAKFAGLHAPVAKLHDTLDSLEAVDFTPKQVYGIIIDTDDLERSPVGYLCARRTLLENEWAPSFLESSEEKVVEVAQAWVKQRIAKVRAAVIKAGGDPD